MTSSDLPVFRRVLALTLVLAGGSLWQIAQLARLLHVSAGSVKWVAAFGTGGLALALLLGTLLATWTPFGRALLKGVREKGARLHPGNAVLLGAAVVVVGGYAFLAVRMGDLLWAWVRQYKVAPRLFFLWLLLFWVCTLAGAALLHLRRAGPGWGVNLAASALVFGVAHRVAAYAPDISAYPFSLTWSEASRYFYASLFWARRLYGLEAALSVLHPTRYFLQSLPFLLPEAPLWLHRAWQVGLWLAASGGTAAIFARRALAGDTDTRWAGLPRRALAAPVGLWAFLFLYQGPVFYHLLGMVAAVLWGFDRRRFWKALAVVVAASAWGGVSRINWIPFPAALAACLYLLETPVSSRPLWRYLSPPAVWGAAGLAAGLAAQKAYITWSGNPPELFSSSFSSALLWYRLLPTTTYPPGVLPGIVLVTLPAAALLVLRLRGRWRAFHPLRLAGLAGALAVFLAGGLVVSAKIGGGSNLHNLDGYLALLLVVTGYMTLGRLAPEEDAAPGGFFRPPWGVLALALAVPLTFTVAPIEPLGVPDSRAVAQALAEIRAAVEPVAARGGNVLFITERQLIMFGEVEGVRMSPEYEKVFLMEMAMAGNEVYFEQFARDLQAARFDLIVSVPHRVLFQDQFDLFGEENNAWVTHVSIPILCYYEPGLLLREVHVQLFTPRAGGPQCPGKQKWAHWELP